MFKNHWKDLHKTYLSLHPGFGRIKLHDNENPVKSPSQVFTWTPVKQTDKMNLRFCYSFLFIRNVPWFSDGTRIYLQFGHLKFVAHSIVCSQSKLLNTSCCIIFSWLVLSTYVPIAFELQASNDIYLQQIKIELKTYCNQLVPKKSLAVIEGFFWNTIVKQLSPGLSLVVSLCYEKVKGLRQYDTKLKLNLASYL